MNSIKAIPTTFKGHRFRSRLEARWAVFFDQLSIKYEYELEGYSLPSGAAYLPDFYLPDLDVFVEIKPHDKFPFAELEKIVEFALAGDRNLLLITGTPTNEAMYLLNRTTTSPTDEFTDEGDELPAEELTPFFLHTQKDWSGVKFGVTPFSRNWTLLFSDLPPNDDAALMFALLQAKGARFEFGEKGDHA